MSHVVNKHNHDRTTTLLALFGEMTHELHALPAASPRAQQLRDQLADLTEEIQIQARRAPTRPAPRVPGEASMCR
jgi:hypothetical protein